VILHVDEPSHSSAEGGNTTDAPHRPYQVRLSHSGEIYFYPREELEPWTRGVFVYSRVSGKRGEILRVDQRTPPTKRPFLVRLQDCSSEFWYSLDAIEFEALRRRGTTRSLECKRQKAERCSLTLVPGKWRLVRGSESVIVNLSGNSGGEIQGTGEDSSGRFSLRGTEIEGALDVRLEYTDCTAAVGDVAGLTGAWVIKHCSPQSQWAIVEEGQAFVAGTEVGFFSAAGGHFDFTERSSGCTRRVLAHSVDLLWWDDGRLWHRIRSEAGEAFIPCHIGDTASFDPPKKSEHGDDDVCKVSRVEAVEDRVLCVAFEASWCGPLPDAMKTEIRIDGREVEAVRGKYAAAVAKGKRLRSNMKGELFFDDVTLRTGMQVSFRFGGQYSGYSWVELLAPSDLVSGISSALYFPSSILRSKSMTGRVSDNGFAVDGLEGEGPQIVLSEKTAPAIAMKRSGRVTTLSLKPYDDDDMASIEIRGPAVISFTFFKTEATYDTMKIAGEEYSGDELPPTFFVPEGLWTRLVWSSDASTTDEGWEFTVKSGLSYLQHPDYEVEFGSREAPWNQPGASSHFAAPVTHIPDNPFGLEDFGSSDVAGKVVILSVSSSSEDPLSDAQLFHGPLHKPILNAARGRAVAVIVVDPQPAAAGIFQMTTADPEEQPDTAPPPIPAVVVGHELGQKMIEACSHGQALTCGPLKSRFSLSVQEPATLDGCCDLAHLCVGSDNVLRAVLAAELAAAFRKEGSCSLDHAMQTRDSGDAAAGPSPAPALLVIPQSLRPLKGIEEVRVFAAHMARQLGIQTSTARLAEQVLAATVQDDQCKEIAGERLEALLRELLRRLLPVKLPTQALLPHPGGQSCGEISDHYSLGRRLGEGSFGVVQQAWDCYTGGCVAVKKMKLKEDDPKAKEDVLKEFELLRDLSHPNLLRVLDLHVSEHELHLVTEFAAAGDLTLYIATAEKIDERWIAAVTRQVLSGCGYLHGRKIVHHDVKPANVLVTAYHLEAPEAHVPLVLLADVGLARLEGFVAQEARHGGGAGNGTKYYMAPESVKLLSGPKTDVFATGIMLHELLSGGGWLEPVDEDGEMPEVDWSQLAHCTAEAISVTKAMIAANVGERLSCNAALALEWFWPSDQVARCHGDRSDPADGAAGVAPGASATADAVGRGTSTHRSASRLRTFARADILRRFATNLLVTQLSRGELQEAHQAFDDLDADRDGVLSESDIKLAFLRCGLDEVAAKEVLLAVDVHGRGVIEFRAFAAAFTDVAALPVHAAYGCAEKLLMQLTGYQSRGKEESTRGPNLASLLKRLDCKDEQDVENFIECFHQHDKHGDGHLTKQEFLQLWGLQPLTSWAPPEAPEPPKALVQMLRGDAEEAYIEGCKVDTKHYTSFGQPALGQRSGRWYYEVKILKSDSPQVGWADAGFETFDSVQEDGVGDDEHGWGVDGERQLKWHKGSTSWGEVWPRPVVIGCALDLDVTPPSMFFSVDGTWDATPAFKDFTYSGYVYPAASGILVGTFCFSAEDCQHMPPDPSYCHLDLSLIP